VRNPPILISVPVEEALEPSDPELVERARGGEREAFGLLYRRHQTQVYRFARSMTGSAALADDIVQDVFLALMRDLARYDVSRAPLKTYLFGIARNLARDRARSVRRLMPLDYAADAVGGDDPAKVHSVNEEIHQLRRCLSGLPARYREVIILSDLHELDYAETAMILKVPIGTVRSRLHRGRHLLLDRLRRREGVKIAQRCLI
jgi:RNA polymerase sigma-70 factor, ECF subfamily